MILLYNKSQFNETNNSIGFYLNFKFKSHLEKNLNLKKSDKDSLIYSPRKHPFFLRKIMTLSNLKLKKFLIFKTNSE